MRALLVFVVAVAVTAAAPLHAKVLIVIDKSAQRMVVAVDGEPLHSWPVSTGRAGRDTPSGKYRAFRMEKDHFSREWDDAPMPNSIFFTQTGHAIHGSYDTDKIGSPASAGCVRLAPDDAETLFALVEEQGVLNTTVEVKGDIHVALARRSPRLASPRESGDVRTRGAYGEPRPRYEERRYEYVRPAPWPYYARQPAYGPPPGYYDPSPYYPRYYRW